MKKILSIKTSLFSLLIVLAGIMLFVDVYAKVAAKKERVRMKMYFYREADGNRKISIGLTAGSGRKMRGVADAEVELNTIINDSTVLLTTLETDTTGIVELYLADDYILPTNEDGVCILEATYAGDETHRSASKDIEVSEIDIAFEFNIEDSVKYLTITASRLDGTGESIPVEELSLNIGVQRLYSVLPIEEVETDEDGVAELEFPDDIPGDADGNITVVAFIDDSDEFGTVTVAANQNWGVPVDYEIKPLARQLFTDEAPIWMIAAVFIILLGAWYHFFLSISKLVKLKKEGSNT